MPHKDPVAKKEYDRQYREKNRERIRERDRDYKREWSRKWREKNAETHRERCKVSFTKNSNFRRNLLSQFSCVCCGETDADLIDWHHVNPENKSFEIMGGLTRPHDVWWEEVLKCVPVCVLCHRKIHTNKLCLLPQSL